jgi:hypothetical protein
MCSDPSSGLPNVVDSFRFSQEDISWLQQCMVGRSGVSSPPSRRPQPPPPTIDEQKLIEARGQRFATPVSQLPWWGLRVIHHRDTFGGAAIGVLSEDSDSQYPAEVFLITLITQRPFSLYGIVAVLSPRSWPLVESASAGQVDPFVCNPFYKVAEAAHTHVSQVPFTDMDRVVVFEGVRHVASGILLTSSPVPLEDFHCVWYQQSAGRQAAERSSSRAKLSLSAEVLARLLREYPWLQECDVARVLHPRRSSGPSHGPAVPAGPMRLGEEDLLDEAVMAVETELAAKRKEWHFDEDIEDYFYLFVAGGIWTKKHKGSVTDSVQFKSRNIAKDFCEFFAWPRSKTFAFNLYGEVASNQLAREWVRKSNHYMQAWLDKGGKEWFRTPESLSHESSVDFLDWACSIEDLEGPTWARIQEVLNQTPVWQR